MGFVGREEALQSPSGRLERILVSVRLRPLNDKELARHDVADWECINDTTIIYRNNLSASDRSLYPTSYSFDRVFRPDGSTRLVYEQGAKEVALSVVGGINSSIFAYGQTSSGKTYTMSGIVEYSVADIFDYIEKHTERDFVLKFSAIEIYNESVRDLLSSDFTPLRLLDDPERGTVVEKLTEETLSDWNHFEELISFCETQRQIGETSLNEASSRSHQILRLTIESSAREFLGNDKSSSLAASVNFVDLAGSERASQTNSAGTRLKEGCHINRSLLTLGTVIRKLSKGRNGHIPFRDSKLTRILQSSLGGNARTAIICTLSPARSHVEQSRNTLLFASCAKEVSTNAQVNVVMSDKTLVKQLQKEVARLESELRSSGPARPTIDTAALLREKDIQIEMLMKEVKELTMQRDLAQSQIKDMIQMVGDDISSLIEVESLELDPQYPKIRVRSPWDIDNQTDPNVFSLDCEESVRSFDASQFYDGNSFSSDENLFQLPDLERNIPVRLSSPELSVTSVDAVSNDVNQQNFERNLPVRISSPGLSVTSVDAVSDDVDQKNRERNLSVRISSPGLSVTSFDAVSYDVDQKNLERNLPVRISSPGLSVTSVGVVSNDVDQQKLERNLPVRISSPGLSITIVDAVSNDVDQENRERNLPVRISSPGFSVTSVDAVSNDVDQKNLEKNLPIRISSPGPSVTSVDAGSIDEDQKNLERNLPDRISSSRISVTSVRDVSNDVDQKNLERNLPVKISPPWLSVTSVYAGSIEEDQKNLERNLPVKISSSRLSVTSVDAVSNDVDQKILERNLPVRISAPQMSVTRVDALGNDVDQKNLKRNLPVRISSPGLSVTSVDAGSIDEDQKNLERNLPVRISSSGLPVTSVDAVSNDVDQKNLERNLPVKISSPPLSVTSVDAVSIDEDPKNFERNLPIKISFPGLSTIDVVSNDVDKKLDEDQQEDGLRKEVRQIEFEDIITTTQTHSNPIDSRSNTYGDSNASSQGADTAISELTEVDNGDKRSVDFCSPVFKEDKRVNHLYQYFVLPSPEKFSPCITENSTSSSRTLKLSRSRSCKACLVRNSYSDWFDENEIIQNTPPAGNEKDFTGRPEGLLWKVCTLNYKSNAERLPCNGYENSAESSAVVEVQNVESPMDKETESDGSLAPKIEGNENLRSFNSLSGHEVPETEVDPIMSAKNSKDVGLDPMQADGESHSDWLSEFKRLQREIIELWDACNVSLVHRTYFFLLFKGDPSDSIYMEVELRRLSFLKQTFSQGNQTLVDGRTLNPESSMRYLRRERQMLSKQMLKRLSKSDRENLYLKWGIQLSSKNRRLQLAHRLWSETEDIEHITESAAVVAKLVGTVEPDQALKEMFGLNFAPQPTSRKSLGWTASMKSLL